MEDNNIKTEENKIWEGSQEVGCRVYDHGCTTGCLSL